MPTEEILTDLMESGRVIDTMEKYWFVWKESWHVYAVSFDHEPTNDGIAASCANKFKRIGPHVIKVETEIEAMKLAMEFDGI